MQANPTRGMSAENARARKAVPSRQASSIVRSRMAVAGVLTLVATLIAVVMGIVFGRIGLSLYVLALPLPLFYLWMAADVVRADERDDER